MPCDRDRAALTRADGPIPGSERHEHRGFSVKRFAAIEIIETATRFYGFEQLLGPVREKA
ncbi:MAG: hypothetical protein HOQ36_01730 [Nocardia sp.]|nr:hypothetical protein [Nocardia sp.]NUS91120.1 hypothetical protein [Nocardia sp.]